MRWLREVVWPVEERLEPEDVYWGTRRACLVVAPPKETAPSRKDERR